MKFQYHDDIAFSSDTIYFTLYKLFNGNNIKKNFF